MAKLGGVTREKILEAMQEFDKMGREAFLESVGANPSNKYYIPYQRKKYDPKPIIARALGTTVDHFSGGRSSLDPVFIRCEFGPQVEGDRKPIKKAPSKAKRAARTAGAVVIPLVAWLAQNAA